MSKCDSNPKAELDKFTLQVLRCCSVQGDKLQSQSSACAPEAPWCLQGLQLQDLPLLGLRSLLGRCSDTEDGNLLIGPVAE